MVYSAERAVEVARGQRADREGTKVRRPAGRARPSRTTPPVPGPHARTPRGASARTLVGGRGLQIVLGAGVDEVADGEAADGLVLGGLAAAVDAVHLGGATAAVAVASAIPALLRHLRGKVTAGGRSRAVRHPGGAAGGAARRRSRERPARGKNRPRAPRDPSRGAGGPQRRPAHARNRMRSGAGTRAGQARGARARGGRVAYLRAGLGPGSAFVSRRARARVSAAASVSSAHDARAGWCARGKGVRARGWGA